MCSLSQRDIFSFQLKCCGLVNGKSDWENIPDSCRCNATETFKCESKYYETVRLKNISPSVFRRPLKTHDAQCDECVIVLFHPAALRH